MTNTNRLVGTRFEADLCKVLYKHGWWSHNMAQNHAGQPADIIAARNGMTVLIDCKDCKNDRFVLSRIEPNQESAMSLWLFWGNKYAFFALRTSKDVYMVPFTELKEYETSGNKSLNINQIMEFPTLNEWLEGVEDAFNNRF